MSRWNSRARHIGWASNAPAAAAMPSRVRWAASATLLVLGACGINQPLTGSDGDADLTAKAESAATARAIEPVGDVQRANTNQKGSLLAYAQVEVKWDAQNELRQDTYLEITNDFPENVQVQFYFVNGDAPLEPEYEPDGVTLIERAHPGWNWVDVQFPMTGNEPTYWSAATGQPKGVPSFAILDPGTRPGRPDPDPDNAGGRTIRGYVVGWAVDVNGHEIRWNHLSGAAIVVDYARTAAWEYRAWAFQAQGGVHGVAPISCRAFNLDTGQCVDSANLPGHIDLDGFEYDACPGRLQFQFPAAGSTLDSPGIAIPDVRVESHLALALCSSDLRQENNGPVTTKAKFDIWNENEVRFSGTERCVTCWDSSPLASYTTLGIPNNFLLGSLHTQTGRARVDGISSIVCQGERGPSVDAALLGVLHKVLRFPTSGSEGFEPGQLFRFEKSGITVGGQGEEVAQILYDIVAPPEEARDGNGQ